MTSLITTHIKENLEAWNKELDEIETFEPQNLPLSLAVKIQEILKSYHDTKVLEQSVLKGEVTLKDSFHSIELRIHHLFFQYVVPCVKANNIPCYNALKLAASIGHVNALTALLSSNIEFGVHYIEMAIDEASSAGHSDALKILLADPRSSSLVNLWLGFIVASQNGFIDILRILADEKRINYPTWINALQVATRYGQIDVLHFLLSINFINEIHFPCIMRNAVENRQSEALSLFIATKIQISKQLFNLLVKTAILNDDINSLRILFSLHIPLPLDLREDLIVKTSMSNQLQCLEMLIKQAPIRAIVRDWILGQAPQKKIQDAVCKIINSAQVYCESIIIPSRTEIEKMSGYYWKFYRSETHDSIDIVLIYKADSSLTQEQISKLHTEYYPALEGNAKVIDPSENIRVHDLLQDPLLQQLYFDIYQIGTEKYYQTPDPDTLKRQWEKIYGFPLQIAVVNGIISDKEYAQSFLDNDLTISERNEYMHDITFHVIWTLKSLIKYKDVFIAYREHQRAVIRKAATLIDSFKDKLTKQEEELLWLGLGVFADLFNDRVNYSDLEAITQTTPDIKIVATEVMNMKESASLYYRLHPTATNKVDFIDKLTASFLLWKEVSK